MVADLSSLSGSRVSVCSSSPSSSRRHALYCCMRARAIARELRPPRMESLGREERITKCTGGGDMGAGDCGESSISAFTKRARGISGG